MAVAVVVTAALRRLAPVRLRWTVMLAARRRKAREARAGAR